MSTRSIPPAKVRRLAMLLAAENFSSITQLSNNLRISRATIRRYQQRIKELGYSFAEFSALSPSSTRTTLRKKVIQKPRSKRYTTLMSILPDVWERVSEGVADISEIWAEYKNRHPHGYGYAQFAEHFRAWRQAHGFRTALPSKWRVTHISGQDVLELKKWRRSNNRIKWAKAVAILDLNQGTPITLLCSKLEKSLRIIKRWRQTYMDNGLDALRSPLHKRQSRECLDGMKKKLDRLVEILHESPQLHGINRASWSLKTLSRAYEAKYGDPIGMSTISQYIRAQGYSFKKARRVRSEEHTSELQ